MVLLLSIFGCTSPSSGGGGDGPVWGGGPDTGVEGPLELPAGAWVLDGVTVVDAEGAQSDRAVVIAAGTIVDVRAAYAAWPDGVEVRDATGQFVVPGLVDAHVHLAYGGGIGTVGDTLAANLRGQLYWGVTQVVDVGGPEVLFAVRDHVAAGELVGPRILATGPMLTAVGSHPCETAPDPDLCVFVDATDASLAATWLRDAGADALKVALADASFSPWGETPRLDVAAIRAAAATGLPVYAHVDEDEDVVDAVDAGATVLAHPPFAGPIGPLALAAGATAEAVHTTVSAFAGVGDLLAGRTDPDDPSLLLTDAVRDDWRSVRDGETTLLAGWPEASAGWAEQARANLGALRAAGATLVPGSDAGYWFVPHGAGLHRELDELVALGYTPTEALAAATRDARAVLGVDGGLIVAGAPADLLLLDADPTLDVAALSAIDTVVLAGVPHAREALRDAATGAFADVCLTDECGAGERCDGVSHTCRPACDTPYDVYEPACGADAWCMPADGAAETLGACHIEAPCDLYGQDCEPAWYGRACVPYDHDTSACWTAGPRQAGESCAWTDPARACGVGLFCSWVDDRCYELCDPDAVDTCAGGARCVEQDAAPGVGWFGICL
ncbi:MAG: amidohydrolase family protein [Pseudomonadota bacterium]|nr:amidohydrolase family protein [Pseudomonadota bacterium]